MLLSLADECFQLDTAQDKDFPTASSPSPSICSIHSAQPFLKAVTRPIREAVSKVKNVLLEMGCTEHTFVVISVV